MCTYWQLEFVNIKWYYPWESETPQATPCAKVFYCHIYSGSSNTYCFRCFWPLQVLCTKYVYVQFQPRITWIKERVFPIVSNWMVKKKQFALLLYGTSGISHFLSHFCLYKTHVNKQVISSLYFGFFVLFCLTKLFCEQKF